MAVWLQFLRRLLIKCLINLGSRRVQKFSSNVYWSDSWLTCIFSNEKWLWGLSRLVVRALRSSILLSLWATIIIETSNQSCPWHYILIHIRYSIILVKLLTLSCLNICNIYLRIATKCHELARSSWACIKAHSELETINNTIFDITLLKVIPEGEP